MKKLITPLLLLLLLSCNKKISKKKVNSTNLNYERAWYFFDHNIPDSSFIYFNKAREDFSNTNDSVGTAKCLINMAIISSDQNDYFGSQEMSLSAIKYLNVADTSEREILSSNYNNLGKVAHQLYNYLEADTFYLKSIKLATKEKSKIIYTGNLAINLSDQKRYPEALNYFNKILKNVELIQDSTIYPRTLTNMSLTKWRQNPDYNPIPNFLKALHIREKKDDKWGQNSSYAHLADYYIEKQSDSALFYADKMYSVAKKIKSPDDQLQALQKLVKLSPTNESKFFFRVYEKLNDSVQFARNTAKNQFALIRYETEKSKADYLKSQAENLRKNKDIILRNIGISTLLTCLILGFIFYRKRQKELKKEKELEVKKTELKYVKKVHDEVANKIYQVMTEVENDPGMDRNEVADQLEIVYNISRNILYQNTNINIKESFFRDVNKMLYAYSSDKVEVVVKGSNEKLWREVEESTKYEVYFILQNLMTNMAKHSGADSVSIEFTKKNSAISVIYFDNGKGMQGASKKNGLTNTENRIENISGSITFDTKPDAGLEIKLSFPI